MQKMAADPALFRRYLIIDADGTPQPFRPDRWQNADFTAMDPAWMFMAGRTTTAPPRRRSWQERPRGHAKTADLAVQATWPMVFSTRPIRGIIAAGDSDQAGLLRDAIATLARLNPWIGRVLDVQNAKVINRKTGSRIDVLTSDVDTSFGHLVDFVACDEISHWRGEKLWESLFSAAGKRGNCVMSVILNAGFTESWAWRVREAIRNDPAWHFSHLDGPQASWISPAQLDEQRRLLPPLAFDRLWLNRWTLGSGDALSRDDIQASFTRQGPLAGAEPGMLFVAGLDLSATHDATALAIVGRAAGGYIENPRWHPFIHESFNVPRYIAREGTGRYRLAELQLWKPASGEHIDMAEIEAAVLDAHRRYGLQLVLVDTWEARYLTQRLTEAGVLIELAPPSPSAQKSMASAMLEVFAQRTIDLYPDADLVRDLHNLQIKAMSYGLRLVSPRDETHGDAAQALAIALVAAGRLPSWFDPPEEEGACTVLQTY